MSGRKFKLHLSSPLLAALAVLALASGCRLFSPKPATTVSTASPSDIRQASFEGDEIEPKKELGLEDFYPDQIGKTVKKMVSEPPNKKEAKKNFEDADAIFRQANALPVGEERQKLLLESAQKFLVAATKFPNSAIEQDSFFLAGEAYFFADYYWDSNLCYEKLIKAYPNNRYMNEVEKRRYAIARYWLDLSKKDQESFYSMNFFNQELPWRDTRGHGLRVFEKMRSLDDPGGKLADDATLALANEAFAANKFYKADEYYSDLRKLYPDSEHQFLANFLGLKAKMKCYVGPEYSVSSLDEGEKLIKHMWRAYPQEAEKEREYLERASAEIRYHKAEKLYHWGEYYDRRKEYRAAAHYYAKVNKEYEDTQFAQRATTRLGEIEGLPPVPAQKFEALVKLIPTSDKIQPMVDAAKKKTPGSDGDATDRTASGERNTQR
jgi:outer membrane protein assembly factor BamD (BamD/ComL family)